MSATIPAPTVRAKDLLIETEECEGHVEELGDAALLILDHAAVTAVDEIPKQLSEALLHIGVVRALLLGHVQSADKEGEGSAES